MSNGHGYGSRQIMGAFWDMNKQKAERNKEITDILLNAGMQGRLKDLKAGTPVYEGLKSQFGGQFAEGLADQNKGIQEQRAMETTVNNFNNGIKLFDTALKVGDMVGYEKAKPLVKSYLSKAKEFLGKAGIKADISHLYDAKTNQENIAKGGMVKMIDLMDKFQKGKVSLNALKAGYATYNSAGFKGSGVKELAESVEKTITNAEKDVDRQEDKQFRMKEAEKSRTFQAEQAEKARKARAVTWGAAEANILTKALEGGIESLKPLEKKILEKKIQSISGTRMSVEEYYNRNVARWNAKLDSYASNMGYKNRMSIPREEKAKLYSSLPWWLMSEESTGEGKKIVREGTHNGKKVVEYEDGTIEYAD
jgi:hypothetical protein